MRNDLLKNNNPKLTDLDLEMIKDRDVRSLTRLKLNIDETISMLQIEMRKHLADSEQKLDQVFIDALIKIDEKKAELTIIEDLLSKFL